MKLFDNEPFYYKNDLIIYSRGNCRTCYFINNKNSICTNLIYDILGCRPLKHYELWTD